MKKSSIVAIVGVVILVLAGLGIWYYQNSKSNTSTTPPATTPSTTSTPVVATSSQGLVVDMPLASTTIASPLVISGHVDGTDKWIGFEGQVGTVKLVDANNNVLANGVLIATTDWMQLTVSFSTTLTFSMPTTTTGTLIFKNENPSGEPSNDREVQLPITF